MTTDDRLLSGAASESSLPPNKSSGDIVERLRLNACRLSHESMDAFHMRRIRVELEAADEIERLADYEQRVGSVLQEGCGRPMTTWQDIGTAPHEVNVLLAYWDEMMNRWQMEAGMASWGWRRDGVSNMSRHGQATHWMPLPSPPSKEGE